jgi:hypothetical protein
VLISNAEGRKIIFLKLNVSTLLQTIYEIYIISIYLVAGNSRSILKNFMCTHFESHYFETFVIKTNLNSVCRVYTKHIVSVIV